MSSQLSDRQKAICERLRQFRISTMASRAAIARRLEIDPERLASYENARAPIRWEIFLRLARAFRINPRWLVTGEGPQQIAFNPRFETLSINPKTLLSTAFDGGVIFAAEASETYEKMRVERFTRPAMVLGAKLDRLKQLEQELRDRVLSDSAFTAALEELKPKLDYWLEEAAKSDQITRRVRAEEKTFRRIDEASLGKGKKVSGREKETSQESQCKELLTPADETCDQHDMAKVTPRWAKLKERLKVLAINIGGKSALAEKAGVSRQTIHSWLDGNAEPSAEKTLRLMELLEAAEETKN